MISKTLFIDTFETLGKNNRKSNKLVKSIENCFGGILELELTDSYEEAIVNLLADSLQVDNGIFYWFMYTNAFGYAGLSATDDSDNIITSSEDLYNFLTL